MLATLQNKKLETLDSTKQNNPNQTKIVFFFSTFHSLLVNSAGPGLTQPSTVETANLERPKPTLIAPIDLTFIRRIQLRHFIHKRICLFQDTRLEDRRQWQIQGDIKRDGDQKNQNRCRIRGTIMKGGTGKKKNERKKVILRQVSQSAVIPPWIYSLSESGRNVIKDSQLTAVKHRKGVNFQTTWTRARVMFGIQLTKETLWW